MSDEFKVQWSVSLPPTAQYAKGDMLNLRGASVAEVDELLDSVLEGDGAFLAKAVEVGALIRAAHTVTLPDHASVPAAPLAQQPAASEPVAQLRVCAHGKRTRREGHGKKGKWVGWFCPERDRNSQCAVEWED